MSKKKANFVEQHIDKIILGVIGLVCLGLLWRYVFQNPYGPKVDGQTVSPGSVQSRLEQKADRLRAKLESETAAQIESFPDHVSAFQQKLACSIPEINPSVYPLIPGVGSQPIESDREYAVPEIPPLQEVYVAHVRGAAYVPTEEVTPNSPYQTVSTKIEDVDLVTVSARMDVKQLYQQFQSSFMGLGVKAAHKDPVLATPVAARVELQRRVLQPDGTWSEWASVPSPETQAYRTLFEKLPLQAEQMPPGGIHVLMAQYKEYLKQVSILQPPAYDFASPRYQYWMPPPYLSEALEIYQKQQDEQRRLQRETAAMGAGGETTMPRGRLGRGARTTPARPDRETLRRRDQGMPGMEEMGPGGITPIRPLARERTLEDIYQDYQKNLITRMDWWSRNEPLLVWAHDDTVEPGKTYQYRIRVGMFNPIAGRDWFRADQESYKNQVVLWSPFAVPPSEDNEIAKVSIPKMLHVFPMDVVKENPDMVEVKVCKYYLGRWRSEEFQVLPGQFIGSVVEKEPEETTPAAGAAAGRDPMAMEMGMPGGREGMAGMTGAAAQTSVESIDYTTDYLYLDRMEEVEWSGTVSALRKKEYSVMLYTTDGTAIYKLPIKQQNWPSDLKKVYRQVQEAERESEGEVLVPRTTQPAGGMTPGMMMPGGPGRLMPPRGRGLGDGEMGLRRLE